MKNWIFIILICLAGCSQKQITQQNYQWQLPQPKQDFRVNLKDDFAYSVNPKEVDLPVHEIEEANFIDFHGMFCFSESYHEPNFTLRLTKVVEHWVPINGKPKRTLIFSVL